LTPQALGLINAWSVPGSAPDSPPAFSARDIDARLRVLANLTFVQEPRPQQAEQDPGHDLSPGLTQPH